MISTASYMLLSEGLSLTAGGGLQVEVDLGVERVTTELEIHDEAVAESSPRRGGCSHSPKSGASTLQPSMP